MSVKIVKNRSLLNPDEVMDKIVPELVNRICSRCALRHVCPMNDLENPNPESCIAILKRFSRLRSFRSSKRLNSQLEKYREIARKHTKHGEEGGFLSAFLDAFLKADDVNAGLLLPLVKHFCKRYSLA